MLEAARDQEVCQLLPWKCFVRSILQIKNWYQMVKNVTKTDVWHFHPADLRWNKISEWRAVHVIDLCRLEQSFLFSFVSRLSHLSLLTPSYKISHCCFYFSGGTDGKLLSQQLLVFFHALQYVYLHCQALTELSFSTTCFCYSTLSPA